MPADPHSGTPTVLVQAASIPPQPVPHVDIPEVLAALPHYLSQMQLTVTVLAAIVAIVTLIAVIIGALFTAGGFLEQRRAQEVIRQFDEKFAKEIAERHQMHQHEVNLMQEVANAEMRSALANLRREMTSMMEADVQRIERMYVAEVFRKLENIEASYASNLRQIGDILITFQEECASISPDGARLFDFLRYNTFEHLLMGLISGGRQDTHTALSRLFEEYADEVGETTAILLLALLAEVKTLGRVSRADLRILVDRLIDKLNNRFPRPDKAGAAAPP